MEWTPRATAIAEPAVVKDVPELFGLNYLVVIDGW